MLLFPGLGLFMIHFLHQLLISTQRTSLNTSTLQVCHNTINKTIRITCHVAENFTTPCFQARCSCSCLIPRGSIPAVRPGDAETPPLPTARGRLVGRRGWAITGPTTPCWLKRGGPACWGTRGWQTACSKTSQSSAPTGTTDLWVSGTAARRGWTPALPDWMRIYPMFSALICSIHVFVFFF